jgi:hypothetical protein
MPKPDKDLIEPGLTAIVEHIAQPHRLDASGFVGYVVSSKRFPRQSKEQ